MFGTAPVLFGFVAKLWRARFDLGKLDVLQPLVGEEQLCPSEYYNPVQSNTAKYQRQRAVGRLNTTNKEEPQW